jgi:hypothetical protein
MGIRKNYVGNSRLSLRIFSWYLKLGLSVAQVNRILGMECSKAE